MPMDHTRGRREAQREEVVRKCKHPRAACYFTPGRGYYCAACQSRDVVEPSDLPLDANGWMKGR